jgi:glycosyltransferase involved in cell wall biosynthesis
MTATAPRVLVTVSGRIPDEVREQVRTGRRPRVDYLELADRLGADLLDHDAALASFGRLGSLLRRLIGGNGVLAVATALRQHRYDVVLTDGEQIGLPLAVLTGRLPRRWRARHAMIVHIISVPKKEQLVRWLRLQRRIDRWIAYADAQVRHLRDLGVPAAAIDLTPFMVDADFFAPAVDAPATERPVISSAGLERRDYPTLLAAVTDLDVDVVIAAASPWSKQANEIDGVPTPANVTMTRLDLFALRELYARSSMIVMPLHETPFQAGITTILEGMSMGLPIVCSRTTGQTNAIVDGASGTYVPVGDPAALRRAIVELLDDDTTRRRLGAAARQWVLDHATIDRYVDGLAAIVRELHEPVRTP